MHGSGEPSDWTRRRFLRTVGRAGGAAAVYETMTALGLLHTPEAFARVNLPRDHGRGRSVAILGAGIAGLTSAYELSQAGYSVTLLEPKSRTGGRSFTVRRGDVIEEIDAAGVRTSQVCNFAEGLYFNSGPGRLPHNHTAILHYCHLFGVPLEIYNMTTRANLFQRDSAFGGSPVQNRRLYYDTRGYISELLAKAIDRHALDDELTKADRDALLDLADRFGLLDGKHTYHGSERNGFRVAPDVTTHGEIVQPLTLAELLSSKYWNHLTDQSDEYEWQATLFQPVGGMDHVAKAFAAALPRRTVRLEREVTSIENVADGVRVTHRNAKTKEDSQQLVADWCISTIPLPILAKIDNNFSPDFRHSIAAGPFEPSCKVGWQANRRFWEFDDRMYGGISYVDHNITQIWYPSTGYFGEKGVLTGAYNYENHARVMATKTPAERLALAAEGAKKLHPAFERWVPRELGLSIAWTQVPWQAGAWPGWRPPQVADYERLLRPEGRVWIAGDQVSYIPGWQEGAIRSANYVVKHITVPETVTVSSLDITRAPDSRRLFRG